MGKAIELKPVLIPHSWLNRGSSSRWDMARNVNLRTGVGSEEGLCPSPENFWNFIPENAAFWCTFYALLNKIYICNSLLGEGGRALYHGPIKYATANGIAQFIAQFNISDCSVSLI